jgi:hypothetical protein
VREESFVSVVIALIIVALSCYHHFDDYIESLCSLSWVGAERDILWLLFQRNFTTFSTLMSLFSWFESSSQERLVMILLSCLYCYRLPDSMNMNHSRNIKTKKDILLLYTTTLYCIPILGNEVTYSVIQVLSMCSTEDLPCGWAHIFYQKEGTQFWKFIFRVITVGD